MRNLLLLALVAIVFSCNDSSTKLKELELKERELTLKERELNQVDSINGQNKESNIISVPVKNTLHESVSDLDFNVVLAKSSSLTIRVDRINDELRYSSWSKGKLQSEEPDIIIYGGVDEKQGSMGGWTWTFNNDGWTYLVNYVQICQTAPECGLFLELYYAGKLERKIRMNRLN